MNKKIKEKLLIITITIILSIINILLNVTYSNAETSVNINDYLDFTINFEESIITSDFSVSYDTEKLTYIGSSTENLKTNYISEDSRLICCYYDLNKVGTNKITLIIIIILLEAIIFFSKYVFAQNEDKILINKNEKNIMIVLSTSNENRNMSIQKFKEKTKATSITSSNESIVKSGEIATFKNNEKYSIIIYGDENYNGIINSSDIFELLKNENIAISKIEEISNFIVKKEEFNSYLSLPSGYEEFNENSIITPSTTPLQPATDRYKTVKNISELKKLDVKIGDKYKTLGYYDKNDGGAGRYDIIEKNNDIKIDNGLYI